MRKECNIRSWVEPPAENNRMDTRDRDALEFLMQCWLGLGWVLGEGNWTCDVRSFTSVSYCGEIEFFSV